MDNLVLKMIAINLLALCLFTGVQAIFVRIVQDSIIEYNSHIKEMCIKNVPKKLGTH